MVKRLKTEWGFGEDEEHKDFERSRGGERPYRCLSGPDRQPQFDLQVKRRQPALSYWTGADKDWSKRKEFVVSSTRENNLVVNKQRQRRRAVLELYISCLHFLYLTNLKLFNHLTHNLLAKRNTYALSVKAFINMIIIEWNCLKKRKGPTCCASSIHVQSVTSCLAPSCNEQFTDPKWSKIRQQSVAGKSRYRICCQDSCFVDEKTLPSL